MALVEVDDIEFGAPQPDKIRAFSIDAPRIGGRNVYDIELAGWVLGIDQPVQEIEIHQGGAVVRKTPLDRERPDVARDYPNSLGAGTSGFRTWVSVIGLEPGADLQVRAVLADGTRARLGGIALRHQPVQSRFEPRLQPLMLTTMGRAGTTWTMRLLSEHPEIVVHRWHPYELRTARYWWHMLKTLSEPRDPYHSAQADRFQTNKQWVGYNPFYPEPITVTPGLEVWMGRDYVEDLARFCQRSAEETYLRIAAGQGQTNVTYMAEKHRADNLPWLVWELYPKAKEIFLVRDFRDVFSSMLAYNEKFGRRAFGPAHIESDADFARFLRNSTIRNLSRSWPKRMDRAYLIRYEDLITRPAEILEGVLTYLELDASETTIDGMIDRASAENPEMKRHLTSSEVSTSLGRWKSSLSPELQAVATSAFSDVLEQFGYQV
ncbi:MAG TPA: sulfotransferase [Thermomicrobiales bacterium]|nr:sulfotransferase [Thermomicrobiales bacterium]